MIQGGNVNKVTLTKYTMNVLMGIGVCALPAYMCADPSTMEVSAAADDCSRDLLMAYFPKPFVNKTLEHFKVPHDQWEAINKELADKDKDIVKNVELKASKISPNPLTDPQQRQAAVKLFRETLLDSFSTVMKAHGVNDEKQIQAMLDDIQQQKAKRFAKCMAVPERREAPMKEQGKRHSPDQSKSSDDDDDRDD